MSASLARPTFAQPHLMKKLKLGESELELLKYVARNPDCQVRDCAEHFRDSRGWGRTTVLKTLDRLREKGLIDRHEVEGVFRYRSIQNSAEIEETLVHQFLNQTMEGSVSTMLSYLHNYPKLGQEDIARLRKLADELEEKQK